MSGGVRTYCALCPGRVAASDRLCAECRELASEVENRMTDTRLQQMRALVDDTRTLAADIQEQRPSDSLARLGVYMNWALQALDHAEKELTE